VDILADGSLDLEDAISRTDGRRFSLDPFKIQYDQSRDDSSHNPKRCDIQSQHTGHPTGRLINQREPYLLEIEEVVRVAKEEGVLLEANAHPERLDLRDYHLQLAKTSGRKSRHQY